MGSVFVHAHATADARERERNRERGRGREEGGGEIDTRDGKNIWGWLKSRYEGRR